MKISLKKKKRVPINYLELTPVANYDKEITDDGLVNVLAPRFKSEFGKNLMTKLKRSPYLKANLDEIGSFVWLQIDGEKKVIDIAKKTQEKFGEKVEPVYDRLTRFLTQLYRNGFIHFKELKKGQRYG